MSTQSDKSTLTAGLSVWSYVPGLLWAALMLAVLTWWLRAQNYEFGTPIWIGTAALAAVSLALFVWAAVRWYRGRRDPAQLIQADTEIKPLAALAMLIGGAALLVLAVYLLWQSRQERVDAVGEVT